MYQPRSTQTYQTKAVYITSGDAGSPQTISGSIVQLSRITDLNYSLLYPLDQPVYLNAGYDSYLRFNTEVQINMAWFHTNGHNEQLIGLADINPATSSLAFNLETEKNLYITYENQLGIDAVGATGLNQTKTVLAIGQTLLASYSISAAVGGLVRSNASFVGLTAFLYSDSSGYQVPAVHTQNGNQFTGLFNLPPASADFVPGATGLPLGGIGGTNVYNDVAALAATEMVMTFPIGTPFGLVFTGFNSCFLQSFNCTLTFDRRELKSMGYAYPKNRPIVYPMVVDLTTEALVSSYQADQLQRIGCLATGQMVNIIVKQPCSNATMFGLYFSELQYQSQEVTSRIGSNDIVSIKWRAIITQPSQVFFSPFVNYIVQPDGTPWGTNW